MQLRKLLCRIIKHSFKGSLIEYPNGSWREVNTWSVTCNRCKGKFVVRGGWSELHKARNEGTGIFKK